MRFVQAAIECSQGIGDIRFAAAAATGHPSQRGGLDAFREAGATLLRHSNSHVARSSQNANSYLTAVPGNRDVHLAARDCQAAKDNLI